MADVTDEVSVEILGRFDVRADGELVDLGGPRQRGVLAVLLLAHGDMVTSDSLIHSLWGGEPPPSATSALQAYISRLRQRLEPGRGARSRGTVIVSTAGGYALRLGAEAVDAWRFERLVRTASVSDHRARAQLLTDALALWRGPMLAEYALEPWAQPEVTRLEALRTLAQEQLADARLESGDAAILVPELERMVEEHPLREERWRLLALAYYRAYRQADALAALRRARQTLVDELGVEPAPALRRLESEILAHAPGLDLLRPEPAAAAPVQPPDPTPPGNGLVGRERETADLRKSLDDALVGEGHSLLVQGPAGIGKSRLLAELHSLAEEAGATCLSAKGSQLEREYAFGVVRQLFDPVMSAELLAAVSGPARAVFDSSVTAADPADSLFAVLSSLHGLVQQLTRTGPLVLIVDDVQWCDRGSLRFLAFLARRLERTPVLLATGLRTGEEHEDALLLGELSQDPTAQVVSPGPLDAGSVADLVRARLGENADETFVAACRRTTSGNPLLLRQLLRALETAGVRPDASHADTVTAIGSRAVSSMVLMRLSRLPEDCAATARAVSVLGDGATLPEVSALAGLSEQAAAAAIGQLARAEVLRSEHPIGFVHPLVQAAVYGDLTPGERELRHGAAASALARSGAATERVAAHLLQVPPRADLWVVEVLRSAARTAMARGAGDAAQAYLSRALAEGPTRDQRPYVLLELGRATAGIDGPAAAEHLRQAFALISDPATRAATALELVRVLLFVGGPGEAGQVARSAVDGLPAAMVDERQALQGMHRITNLMHGVDIDQLPPVRRGDVVGEGIGTRMLAASLAWQEVLAGRDREACVEWARLAIAGGQLQAVDMGFLWVVAANSLEVAERSADLWDQALREAEAGGTHFALLAAHLWRGHALWRRGDLTEALVSVTAGLEWVPRVIPGPVAVWYALAKLAGIHLDRGDVAAARAALSLAPDRPPRGDGGQMFSDVEVRVLLAEGRYAEALQTLDLSDAAAPPVDNPAWRAHRSLRAAVLAGLGRRDEALTLLDDEVAAARRWGAPGTLGGCLRRRGELTGSDEDLREAVRVLRTSRHRLELARALYGLARAGVLTPRERAEALREGEALAHECGADGLLAQVRAASG